MSHNDFDMSALTLAKTGDMDDFLSDKKQPDNLRDLAAESQDRFRVASVGDLDGFTRVASNTLVRKSENDLWQLEQTEDGAWVVERLFDEDGNPIQV